MNLRSFSVKLDNTERKILYELDMDARQSNSSISKKISMNKNIVTYRINNLIKKNVIKGFYTVIDTTKLGYEGYRIYLKWQYLNPEIEMEIIDHIVNSDLTWWVGRIEGEWDVGFLVWVENAYQFLWRFSEIRTDEGIS